MEAAARLGLQAIALTDHDTVAGVDEAREAGRRRGIRVLSGVELTAEYRGHDIHLLGYAFDPGDAALARALDQARRAREERCRGMVERLNALGIPLRFEEVREQAAGGSLGRPHVAEVLVRSGAVESVSEAFRRFLRPGTPAFVPRRRLSLDQARRLVARAGGVVVLAHPHLNLSSGNIQALVGEGIDGLEAMHPRLEPEQCRSLAQWAEAGGLLVTGGSDCHGARRPPLRLGTIRMPMAAVDRLERRAARRAAEPGPAGATQEER